MTYIYLLLSTLFSGGGLALNKLLERSLKPGFANFTRLNFFNAVYGCIFLLIACKFHVQLNTVNILFALLYAVIVYVSICVQILFLSTNPVTLLSLTNIAGSLIISFVAGFTCFEEPIQIKLVVSAILMLIAFTVPYIRTKQKKIQKKTILYGILLFLTNGANAVVLKFFTQFEAQAQAHAPSMFFLTNFFLLMLCGILLLFLKITQKKKLDKFTPMQHLYLGGNTLFSNIISILTTLILLHMHVSVYTILNASLTLLIGALVSIFIFKEKSTKENNLALCLAILAIILSV